MDKKRTVGLVLIGVLAGLLIGSFVFASSSGPTWVLEDYSLMSCASYIIGKTGDTCYVRNGETGEVSSDYASDVYAFADARDNAYSDGGGTVFVRAGTYTFATAFGTKDGVSWLGEGATVITGYYFWIGANATISRFTFDASYLHTKGDYVNVIDCAFRNSHYELYIESSCVTVRDCLFDGATWYGVYVAEAEGGDGLKDIHILDNDFVNCDQEICVLAQEGPVNNTIVGGNIIDDDAIGTQKYGIYFQGVTSEPSIHDPIISNNIIKRKTTGIRLYDVVMNATISNNRVTDCTTGIELADADVNGTFVHDNYLLGCTTAIDDSGTDTTTADNIT